MGLKHQGFELMDNHLSGLIEKIKMFVIKRVQNLVDKNEIRINQLWYNK